MEPPTPQSQSPTTLMRDLERALGYPTVPPSPVEANFSVVLPSFGELNLPRPERRAKSPVRAKLDIGLNRSLVKYGPLSTSDGPRRASVISFSRPLPLQPCPVPIPPSTSQPKSGGGSSALGSPAKSNASNTKVEFGPSTSLSSPRPPIPPSPKQPPAHLPPSPKVTPTFSTWIPDQALPFINPDCLTEEDKAKVQSGRAGSIGAPATAPAPAPALIGATEGDIKRGPGTTTPMRSSSIVNVQYQPRYHPYNRPTVTNEMNPPFTSQPLLNRRGTAPAIYSHSRPHDSESEGAGASASGWSRPRAPQVQVHVSREWTKRVHPPPNLGTSTGPGPGIPDMFSPWWPTTPRNRRKSTSPYTGGAGHDGRGANWTEGYFGAKRASQ